MKIHIDVGALLRRAAPYVVPVVVAAATSKLNALGEKALTKAATPKAGS